MIMSQTLRSTQELIPSIQYLFISHSVCPQQTLEIFLTPANAVNVLKKSEALKSLWYIWYKTAKPIRVTAEKFARNNG
jgi:hypothetical protein